MKMGDIKIETNKATTEDILINAVESFANAADKVQKSRMERIYGKDSMPNHVIRCTTTQVTEVYFMVKSDKSSDEIYSLIDCCNSEEDMCEALSSNDICYIDREKEFSEDDRFDINEVYEY